MRVALLLALVACGGSDAVPSDVVRVQLIEDGEPLRLVPVYFSNVDGSLVSDTETDLDGIADGRVGAAGIVTIFVRDTYVTLHDVLAGTSIVYELPFASGVLSEAELTVPSSGGNLRVTDGCGGNHRVNGGFSSIKVPWRCIQETGTVDLVGWAQDNSGAVTSAGPLLEVEIPIEGGPVGSLPPFGSSLDTVDVDWSNAPTDRSVIVDARAVRQGRRHRGGQRSVRDATGSATLVYSPSGFADAFDVVFSAGQPNRFGGGGEAHRVTQAIRRLGGGAVSADLADLEPAAEGSFDGVDTVTIDILREPADAVAVTAELSLVDEDGARFDWLAVGPPGSTSLTFPDLAELELTVEGGELAVTVVASDAVDAAGYLSRWVLRDDLQGLAPVEPRARARWTWWTWVASGEPAS